MTVQEFADSVDLHVETWSPGDGVTRYRFHRRSDESYNSGNEIATVLGRKAAMTFLRGVQAGRGL